MDMEDFHNDLHALLDEYQSAELVRANESVTLAEAMRDKHSRNASLYWGKLNEVRAGVGEAVAIAVRHGGTDGAHHKDWVIDQMVRALTGDRYSQVVAEARDGEDGPEKLLMRRAGVECVG